MKGLITAALTIMLGSPRVVDAFTQFRPKKLGERTQVSFFGNWGRPEPPPSEIPDSIESGKPETKRPGITFQGLLDLMALGAGRTALLGTKHHPARSCITKLPPGSQLGFSCTSRFSGFKKTPKCNKINSALHPNPRKHTSHRSSKPGQVYWCRQRDRYVEFRA